MTVSALGGCKPQNRSKDTDRDECIFLVGFLPRWLFFRRTVAVLLVVASVSWAAHVRVREKRLTTLLLPRRGRLQSTGEGRLRITSRPVRGRAGEIPTDFPEVTALGGETERKGQTSRIVRTFA